MKIEVYLLLKPNDKYQLTSVENLDEINSKGFITTLIHTGKLCNEPITKWAKKNNPKMIVKDIDTGKEYVYDYLNGYVGEQLQLKV